VFKNSFIPRRLDEVTHFERDAARIATGGYTEGIYYQTVTGLEADLSGVRTVPSMLQQPGGGEGVAGDDAAPEAAQPVEPAETPFLAPPPAGEEAAPAAPGSHASSSDEEEEEEGSAAGSGDERGTPSTWKHRPEPLTREELRSQRRDNKDAVKEAQRERRKTKLPKHLKKKRVNAGKK
jgi:RIO kinase 1